MRATFEKIFCFQIFDIWHEFYFFLFLFNTVNNFVFLFALVTYAIVKSPIDDFSSLIFLSSTGIFVKAGKWNCWAIAKSGKRECWKWLMTLCWSISLEIFSFFRKTQHETQQQFYRTTYTLEMGKFGKVIIITFKIRKRIRNKQDIFNKSFSVYNTMLLYDIYSTIKYNVVFLTGNNSYLRGTRWHSPPNLFLPISTLLHSFDWFIYSIWHRFHISKPKK